MEVKAKINTLRTYFSKELAKSKDKRSGAGTDDIYESKWPYFKSMLFLTDIIKPRKTTSSLVGTKINSLCKFLLPWYSPCSIKKLAETISNFFAASIVVITASYTY